MKTDISIQYKMVVLTIVTQNNGETIYFDEPFSQVHSMKLILCSLYNSWHNLKSVGQIYFKEKCWLLPQGHYTSQSLAEELTESLESNKNKKRNNTRNK